MNGILTIGLKLSALQHLTRDGWLLFVTRFVRVFAYGALSVVLVLYLNSIGFGESRTGILLTLTLIGDTLISLWLTTRADRIGRRRVLKIGALLMAMAGLIFASTRNMLWLILAGTVGVISPSGNEVGPFLSVEQAALSHVISDRTRTPVFAWYTVAGAFATAVGSLFAGSAVQFLQARTPGGAGSYRAIVVLYAALGVLLLLLFSKLSAATEINSIADNFSSTPSIRSVFGLSHSRGIVLKLSRLFALDAFAGGFVMQSFAAWWFHARFGVNPATLGSIFFGANVLAGVSALLASRLASRFGLVNAMVFTHLPSNVLLILVPVMPTLSLAVLMLFLRFSISQMDVPTRQSYTMAVVRPEERSATAGITGVARTIGASVAPLFAGFMFARPALMSLPFFIAGALKIVYDLLLYREFVSLRPPEEISAIQ